MTRFVRWLFPKVRNSVGEQFATDCRLLQQKIEDELRPDLVLAVETGGRVVLAEMISYRPVSFKVGYASARRGFTPTKSSRAVSSAIRRLPRLVSNALRRTEHQVRLCEFTIRRNSVGQRYVSIDPETIDTIRTSRSVCVLDDAVDTGSTLSAVSRAVLEINPSVKLSFAVIAQTFPNPLVRPSVFVYERELVRFPWASDA